MTNDNLAIEERQGLEIGVFPLEDKWEVVLDQTSMIVLDDRETAIDVSKSLYIAYETGYINGLILGKKDQEEATHALLERGFDLSLL